MIGVTPAPGGRVDTPGPAQVMTFTERGRLRDAARRARTVFPGPVGEWLYRELHAWDEFGRRFGGAALTAAVVADIERRAREQEQG